LVEGCRFLHHPQDLCPPLQECQAWHLLVGLPAQNYHLKVCFPYLVELELDVNFSVFQ
jgi:hypothetical protein